MIVALFASVLFLGAFLMFSVEPMIAKMVLPILGGAPMVWNTCVVFFQIALLGGYALAFLATARLRPRLYAAVYGGLLLVSLLALPIALRIAGDPPLGGVLILWLLAVLTISIGLPFLVLSTSTSMLQKMLTTTGVKGARDPYFLYAASNAGSLIALLMYPTVLEPSLSLPVQRHLWTIGYVVFIGLALVCAVIAQARSERRVAHGGVPEGDSGAEAPLAWTRRAKWMALAAIPSSLMLGVTTYVSTDIAAVPLLWIVPLALYLLTLVVAFSSRADFARALVVYVMPLLIVPLVMIFTSQTGIPLSVALFVHLLVFTLGALGCHVLLARDRPAPRRLSEFYFWIALGGVFGGLFNTIVAPLLFTGIVEYQLALVLALIACLAAQSAPIRQLQPRDVGVPIGVGIGTALLLLMLDHFTADPHFRFAALGPVGVACFSQKRQPLRFAAMLVAMMIGGAWTSTTYGRALYTERTFFGVYRVSFEEPRFRSMYHGTTLHGMQSILESDRREPLTYYHRTSPFDQAWSQVGALHHIRDVAVVGLGIGTLASYAQADQHWTFYEIDPAVERIARTEQYFTFLRDCGGNCQVVLGDARRSLSRARGTEYDMIILDAFSSDAIPVHLITNEALALYLAHLAPRGVLALHISNRHLSLGPVLGRLADHNGLAALEREEALPETALKDGLCPSTWVLMARDRSDLETLARVPLWRAPTVASSTPLWTDDYSDLVRVIRFNK